MRGGALVTPFAHEGDRVTLGLSGFSLNITSKRLNPALNSGHMGGSGVHSTKPPELRLERRGGSLEAGRFSSLARVKVPGQWARSHARLFRLIATTPPQAPTSHP